MKNQEPHSSLNLRAALIAVGAALVLIAVLTWVFEHLPRGGMEAMLAEHDLQKDLGVKLQQEGFSRRHLLPIYGSSELTRIEENRPDKFFRSMPTGFQICPVGQAGNTTFLTAQKIGSVGAAAKGKKVVVLLSASWFRRDSVPQDHYAGNFSASQAMGVLSNTGLSKNLRHRLAMRMLDFPATLADHPVLLGSVRKWAGETTALGLASTIQYGLTSFQAGLMRFEDSLGTVVSLVARFPGKYPPPPHKTEVIDWDRLIGNSTKLKAPTGKDAEPPETPANAAENEAAFFEGFAKSREWDDFDLMMSVFQAMDMDALVIMIPLDGAYEDAHGVSLAARNVFYKRGDSICRAHGYRMEWLPEYDQDPDLVVKHSSHLTRKGWLVMDQLLDDFYHDRIKTRVASISPTNKP